MTSIRFGLIAVAIIGLVALGARVQVARLEGQIAALADQQEATGLQIVELQDAMEALVDLETGQRGYLLTGDPSYLRPYETGYRNLDRALGQLAEAFPEDDAAHAAVAEIAKLARAKRAELERSVELRKHGDAAAALAVVNTGDGRNLMDAFSAKALSLTERLRQAHAQLVAEETQKFRQVATVGGVVIVLIILLVVGAVGWLGLSIRRLDQLQREREREAMHDALTGLPNRRYFIEWLNMAFAAAQRGGRRLVLLYLDLDGFKRINDSHGHDAGDRVLQVTAERLRGTLRSSDFVARLGGDEFAAVLLDAPAEPYLLVLLKRLGEALARSPMTGVADGAISATIGTARFPGDGASPAALISAADHAMHVAKEERRSGAVSQRAPLPFDERIAG